MLLATNAPAAVLSAVLSAFPAAEILPARRARDGDIARVSLACAGFCRFSIASATPPSTSFVELGTDADDVPHETPSSTDLNDRTTHQRDAAPKTTSGQGDRLAARVSD